jgi:ABC-2 type transport system permease protein
MINLNKKYLEYFKIGFKKSIEYKSYLFGVFITPTFMGIFFYFIWDYIYEVKSKGVPNFQIGGFTFEEMLVYLIIGLLINTARNSDVSDKIADIIKTGNITVYLCRPVSFVKGLLFEGIGEKVVNFLIFLVLLIFMTNFFNLPYPKGAMLLIFLIYTVLMIIFNIMLYIIIGGLSFWFIEIWGIRSSIEQVLWILSGRILPLSLFPEWAQTFLQFTPFYYLEYTFASLYLEKLSIEKALETMGIFAIWIFLLTLFMIWIYKKGYRKLASFGG